MELKSSVAVVQTTPFKRKHPPRGFSTPAAPFNNTSFLIQLQQLRELHNGNNRRSSSSTKRPRFDQYGSMDKIIAASFAEHDSMPFRTNKSSNPSSNILEQSSPTRESSTAGIIEGNSDSPERRIPPGESDVPAIEVQSRSRNSEDASSTETPINAETRSE